MQRAPRGPDGNIDNRFVREDGCGLMFLAFNMSDPIWGALDGDGRALRKAVAQALDRGEWVKWAPAQTMTYRLAEELLPPRCWPTGAGASRALEHNRDAAKQSLAGCKYKNGIDPATGNALQLQFVVAKESIRAELFEVWRSALADLGIVLTLAKPTPDKKTFEAMRRGEGQLYLFGWLNDVPDVGNFLQIFANRNISSPLTFCNYVQYQSKEFEKLLSRFDTLLPNEANAEGRRSVVKEIVRCLEKDAPIIPLAVNQEWSYRYGNVEWPDMPRCAYDHVRYAKWKQR
jgi:ABC-type oligopeptide transport system substrate-binding subunit